MNHTKYRRMVPLLLMVLLLTLAACGGNGDTADNGETAEPADATQGDTDAQETEGAASPEDDGELESVVFANPTSAPHPLFTNIVIGDELGYFAEEGVEIEFTYLGSNAAVAAALESGEADFGIMNPFFQVTQAAQGEELPYTNFYQYTYQPKWNFVTTSDSEIESMEDLGGATIGIVGFNSSDESIARQWLSLAGVDPESVDFQVVKGGAPTAAALEQGHIDAAVAWNSHLGFFDIAGIDYRVIPPPANLPVAGGFNISALKDTLLERPALAVAVGRAVARGTQYALDDLEAAAEVYLKMYPGSAPAGQSAEEAAQELATSIQYRAQAWERPEGYEWGQIREAEWTNAFDLIESLPEIESTDDLEVSMFVFQDLIPDINAGI